MVDWVRVTAPVRVLDAGGWTDTWFARTGRVCHVAVGPGADVVARRTATPAGSHPSARGPAGPGPDRPGRGTGPATVHLEVPSFGDEYEFSLGAPPWRHPLLEAALQRWAPPGCHLDVTLSSAVPPGSSLGTSASVLVALVAALQVIAGQEAGPAALARAAHQVETVDLGLQSGVQDQAAAAFGGANVVDIDPYPSFSVTPLELSADTWQALAQRVFTVYLGARHDSSATHETVIKRLAGDDHYAEELLEPLRATADRAAKALVAGDIGAYGDAMVDNTRAQQALHPALVSTHAQAIIDLARRHGALGWKVNGAGGDGGTVTIIGGDAPGPLQRALEGLDGVTLLPLLPSTGGARVVDQG